MLPWQTRSGEEHESGVTYSPQCGGSHLFHPADHNFWHDNILTTHFYRCQGSGMTLLLMSVSADLSKLAALRPQLGVGSPDRSSSLLPVGMTSPPRSPWREDGEISTRQMVGKQSLDTLSRHQESARTSETPNRLRTTPRPATDIERIAGTGQSDPGIRAARYSKVFVKLGAVSQKTSPPRQCVR